MSAPTVDDTLRYGAREMVSDLRRWLGSGDLQSPEGAICAWRDRRTGELAFEYPEITGYYLTWLAGRAEPTDDEIASGRRAGRWLVDRLERGDRSARAGWDGGAVYTFDLGMIAAGLISFGRLVGEEAMERQGRATAAALAGWVDSSAGLKSVAPDGPATNRSPEWSTEGRPHLVKCVQSLLLADEMAAAEALVRSVADFQAEDGRFRTQPDDDRVMLHPHLYTVEGLWIWGTARGDESALARARLAVEWAWEHQLPSGGFPRYTALADRVSAPPEQWDVTAQAVRAARMLDLAPPGLATAVERILGLARSTDAGRALVYQPESGAEHHNAWVSMFGAQALELVADGPAATTWAQLV